MYSIVKIFTREKDFNTKCFVSIDVAEQSDAYHHGSDLCPLNHCNFKVKLFFLFLFFLHN